MPRRTALLTVLLALSVPTYAQQVAPPANTSAGDVDQPTGQPAAADAFASARWPMQVPTPDGQVTVFEPQLEDFSGDTLKARAAVSITPPTDAATTQPAQPVFGAIWLSSRVATDRVTRTVRVLDVNITRDRFPNMDSAREQNLVAAIRSALNANPPTLSLDELLAMLETVQKEQSAVADFKTDPPRIIFRDHPAVLVAYDGQPKLVDAGNNLQRVVNTPFFVVLDPPLKTYFLKGGGRWFSSADPMGPFHLADKVPAEVASLADSDDYKDPQQPISEADLDRLEIVTATEPTELIWSDGKPQMGTIPGSDLLYVTNTDADWFVTIDNQQNYVLISGRWYSAPNDNGPWTFVPPDKLPDVFKKIPPNSQKGDVLAQIAGTQAAKDAIADAAVPQTAEVDRNNFQQPGVTYDGAPQFQPAGPGVNCTYAVNTDASVVCVNGVYYCCSEGVWYQSPSPTGPWSLCLSVPPVIYTIPPSCPIYPCSYCYVYGYTPNSVYCGYLPGYVGDYCWDGVVIYGTGWHYHPWFHNHYFPRPWTYGFAAHYNSYVGHWGFEFGLAGGGGSIWIGTGDRAWGRHLPWFGYGGYRPAVEHNEVRPDLFRVQYLNRIRPNAHVEPAALARQDLYGRNLYMRRGDVRTALAAPRASMIGDIHGGGAELQRPGAAQANRLPEIDRGGMVRGSTNDVFTDREGNIYRRTDNGWEIRDQGAWRGGIDQTYHTMGPNAGLDRAEPGRAEPGRANETPTGPGGIEVDRGRQPAVTPEPRTDVGRPGPAVAPEPSRGDAGFSEVNRDFGAREAGEQRFNNYERSAPSEPAHVGGGEEGGHFGGGGGGGGGFEGGGRAGGGAAGGGGGSPGGGGGGGSGHH